ncbi:MAG TPA: hypothetical protein VNJ04_04030 [Gemmatimonadaceae bacterium]|nr:hypothetical protein [Gemmatimonadaceae bacterium]
MKQALELAASWLRGLASRGVVVSIRNGRLSMTPTGAYKTLTEDELITLRRHRAEIKEYVLTGIPLDVVRAAPSSAEKLIPDSERCKSCSRAPCIGPGHAAYYDVHPDAPRAHSDRRANAEMLRMVGRLHPWGPV